MEKYLSKDGLEYLIEGLDPRYAKEKDLADVAKSGSYDDLTDKPSIPSTPEDIDAMPASTTLADLGGIALTEKGANSGVAPLNAGGKIDSQYLPSYVDDVIECYVVDGYEAFSANWLSKTDGGYPLLPEGDKIYVILSSGDYLNKVYRWGGTAYVSIGGDIDLSAYATQTWVQNQGYLTSHQDISGKADSSSLALVATSGDYTDLTNKPTIPTIPTNVSSFINDAGYLTSHQDISGKANSADLATVATSGDYTDLINKPTIPSIPSNVSAFTNDAGYLTQHQSLSGYATETWVGNQGFLTSHQDISGKVDSSDLADVATSGDYDDLINKPTIPSAYTLPTASTSVLGGVKVDGSTITIDDGIVSVGNQFLKTDSNSNYSISRLLPNTITGSSNTNFIHGDRNTVSNSNGNFINGTYNSIETVNHNLLVGSYLQTNAADSLHIGYWNVPLHGIGNDAIAYRFTIGNGQTPTRSNLFGIDNDGNILTSGYLYLGCSDLSALEGNNKVAITDEGVVQESYDEFVDENENSDILKDGSTQLNGSELVVSSLVYSPADNSLEQEFRTVIGGSILTFEAMNPLTQIPLSRSLVMDSNGQLLWNGNPLSSTNYTAGANIQINNGVISATDTTYSAGNGISINNGVISASGSSYTAGNGIDITNGVISFDDVVLDGFVLENTLEDYVPKTWDNDSEDITFSFNSDLDHPGFTIEQIQNFEDGDGFVSLPINTASINGAFVEINSNVYDEEDFHTTHRYFSAIDGGGFVSTREEYDENEELTIQQQTSINDEGIFFTYLRPLEGENPIETDSNISFDGETGEIQIGGDPIVTESQITPLLDANISSLPGADGTYMLVCTISNGEASSTWESITIGGSY